MNLIPHILLNFSQSGKALPALIRERKEIKASLQDYYQKHRIEIREEFHSTYEDLKRVFVGNDTDTEEEQRPDQAILFHFGGHAGAEYLELEDQSLNGQKIAELLRWQKHLKLVFLNACESLEIAGHYVRGGVPMAIATTRKIGDQAAMDFATVFYQQLGQGSSILESFNAAGKALDPDFELEKHVRYFQSSTELTNAPADGDPNPEVQQRAMGRVSPTGIFADREELEWVLIVNEEIKTIVNWRLGDWLLQEVLRAGSSRYFQYYRARRQYADYIEIGGTIAPSLSLPTAEGSESVDMWQAFQTLVYDAQHFHVSGEGGIGKTRLLQLYWEGLLMDSRFPVPLFVPLQDYQLEMYPRDTFVTHYILHHYIDHKDTSIGPDDLNRLFSAQHQYREFLLPSVMLLLDGLNEIPGTEEEKRPLYLELRRLSDQFAGLKIILTSRNTENQGFLHGRNNYLTVALEKLSKENVLGYIASLKEDYAEELFAAPYRNPELLELLRVPLYLKLYVYTSHYQNAPQYAATRKKLEDLTFLQPANTRAALMSNFVDTQLIKADFSNNDGTDQTFQRKKYLWTDYITTLVVRQRALQQYAITLADWRAYHESVYQYGYVTHPHKWLLDVPLEIAEAVRYFFPGDAALRDRRVHEIVKFFTEEVGLLVPSRDLNSGGVVYHFSHEDFMNFLAALSFCAEILASVKGTHDLTEGYFALVQLDRETAGLVADFFIAYHAAQKQKGQNTPSQPYIVGALDRLRGRPAKEVAQVLNRLIQIYHSGYGDLAELDLSRLDLSASSLEGFQLGVYAEGRWQGPDFRQSKLSMNTFLPSRHQKDFLTKGRSGIFFSPSGNYLASYSEDGLLIVWNNRYNFAQLYLTFSPNSHLIKICFLNEEKYLLVYDGQIVDQAFPYVLQIYDILSARSISERITSQQISVDYLSAQDKLLIGDVVEKKLQLLKVPDLLVDREADLGGLFVEIMPYRAEEPYVFVLSEREHIKKYDIRDLSVLGSKQLRDLTAKVISYHGFGYFFISAGIESQQLVRQLPDWKAITDHFPKFTQAIQTEIDNGHRINYEQWYDWEAGAFADAVLRPSQYAVRLIDRGRILFQSDRHAFDWDLRTYQTNFEIQNESNAQLGVKWMTTDDQPTALGYLQEGKDHYGLISICNAGENTSILN